MSAAGSFVALLTIMMVASSVLAAFGVIPAFLAHGCAAPLVGWSITRILASSVPWAALGGFGITVGLLGLLLVAPGLAYAPHLLISFAFTMVAWLFAQGLRAGETPLLLRLIHFMNRQPAHDPEFVRFMRGQCVLWAVLSATTSLTALMAMVRAPASGPLLAGLIVFQIVWFVVSHEYARWRYDRPETWLTTLRTLLDARVWPILLLR